MTIQPKSQPGHDGKSNMLKQAEARSWQHLDPRPAEKIERIEAAAALSTGRGTGHDGEPQVFIENKDFVYVNGAREPVLGQENVNVNRISYLEHRGIIEKYHKEAARIFVEDCEMADISPLATSPLAGVGGRTQRHDYHPGILKMEAMRRKGAALKALGPIAAHFIERVVLDRMSAEKAGNGFGFNEKASVGALRVALDVLASHYGLV